MLPTIYPKKESSNTCDFIGNRTVNQKRQASKNSSALIRWHCQSKIHSQ